jgi:hypothetical protein
LKSMQSAKLGTSIRVRWTGGGRPVEEEEEEEEEE